MMLIFIFSISLISAVSANDNDTTFYNQTQYVSTSRDTGLSNNFIPPNSSTYEIMANNHDDLGKMLSNIHDNGTYLIHCNSDAFVNTTINIGDKNKSFNPNIFIGGDYINFWKINKSTDFKVNVYSGSLSMSNVFFAQDDSEEYSITNYANLRFDNSYFVNNNNFIKNYGNLSINHCRICYNNASESFLSNQMGTVSINNSHVEYNRIHLIDNNANLTLDNTDIIEKATLNLSNLDENYYIKNLNGANLYINGNDFYQFNNSNTSIIKNYGNLSVENNSFNNNTVRCIIENYASAFIKYNDFNENNLKNSIIYNDFDKNYSQKDYIYIKSNNFISNTAQYGSLLFNKAKAIFNTNNATNNTVLSKGGCIFNKGKLITHNNNFKYNHAVDGGVIFNSKVLDSSKDYYNHNTAVIGGCIYNLGNTYIVNAMIKYSNAINASAIYTIVGNLTIDKSNLNKNKANDSGIIVNNGILKLNYDSFYYNKANNYGGVILNYYSLLSYRNAYKHNIASTGSAIASCLSEHKSGHSSSGFMSLYDVFTLNKAFVEATIFNEGYSSLINYSIKTMGVNNYLIVNKGILTLKKGELVNYNHLNETLIKNMGKLYNSTC